MSSASLQNEQCKSNGHVKESQIIYTAQGNYNSKIVWAQSSKDPSEIRLRVKPLRKVKTQTHWVQCEYCGPTDVGEPMALEYSSQFFYIGHITAVDAESGSPNTMGGISTSNIP